MKVYFDSIGCRLNQSEIEKMAAQARLNGHEIVAQASQADIVIINTCAVTTAAGADSRKKIRQAARAGSARVAATGCYATIAPAEIAALPEVEWQIPNNEKDILIARILGNQTTTAAEGVQPREALPGRQRRTRAFIKVQDGCDNFCTFCITRIARGKSRSQTKKEIFMDIEAALAGGVREIVLTGVNMGSWGRDIDGQPSFSSLVKEIVKTFSPERLRLSSLEPWDIKDDFLEILTLPGFCRHLHLPLQSGSVSVLRRMGRRNSPQDYQELLDKLRDIVPEIAITTDIIVGFPGENEREFSESVDFVRRMCLAGGHVFNFSARPGTAAEQMQECVPVHLRRERSAAMRQVIEDGRQKYMASFIGKTERALWERASKEAGKWIVEGLTDNYLRVQASAESDLHNTISRVRLQKSAQQFITGIIVD